MDVMSARGMSRRYSDMHARFVDVARSNGLTPFDVRVLTAVHGRNGECVSDQLEGELLVEGSAVRRSLAKLYRAGYLSGEGVDGRQRRPGTRTRVRMTEGGMRLMVGMKPT